MNDLVSKWRNLQTRGQIKRAAKEIEGNEELRQILLCALSEEGIEHTAQWNAKRLLRSLLNRSTKAQQRSNPIYRNEAFQCVYCCRYVPLYRSKIRDHCPFCLRSIHVDNTPGDRAANCGFVLQPTGFFMQADELYIEYQCTGCEHRYRVRSHPEDQIPPSLSVEDLP